MLSNLRLRKATTAALFLSVAYGVHRCFFESVPGIVVETASGKVKGIISKSRDGREFYEWLGIPYAQPPLGALRFSPPQPIQSWVGVREASSYGKYCLQMDLFYLKPFGSEDCLFLNIHTPKDRMDEGRLLPVLFSIHGGYFVTGFSDLFRPTYFMDEDILLVTINYRLGAFGFLSTNDAAARGNMGLRDQLLALKWVRQNIANFGGDPNEITVIGESAGGVSAGMLSLSPLSRGLMQRIICQSGTALSRWAINVDPLSRAKSFGKSLGCPSHTNNEALVNCLRDVDAVDLAAAHVDIMNSDHSDEIMFVPTVERLNDSEAFLPKHPRDLYQESFPKVPMLIGMNNDEGRMIGVELLRNESFKNFVAQDWRRVLRHISFFKVEHFKHAAELGKFYFNKTMDEPSFRPMEMYSQIADLSGDYMMGLDMIASMRLHSKHEPVYSYWYAQKGPSIASILGRLKKKWNPAVEYLYYTLVDLINELIYGIQPMDFGVTHSDELFMQFEMPPLYHFIPSGSMRTFSKDFIKSWVEFAYGKRPTFRGVEFPVSSPGKENIKFIEIRDTPEPVLIDFPHQERLELWDKLSRERKSDEEVEGMAHGPPAYDSRCITKNNSKSAGFEQTYEQHA